MARPRIRNSSDFLLYSADTCAGWQVIKCVAYLYAESRVECGEWRRVCDGFGAHVGYQPLERRLDATESADASRGALARPEMEANAGLRGRSRTMHMADAHRVGRRHPLSGRLLPEEDFVERVEGLMQIYPQSANRGGDRAVRVYPKVPPVWKPKAKMRLPETVHA